MNLATSPLRLTSNLRAHGASNISIATAPATSPFSRASQRSCARATTTMRSSAGRLTLALPTLRSGRQRQSSHSHRSDHGECAEGRRADMTRLMLALLLTAFAIGSAAAQAPGTCENKAIGKDGRELAGAARTAFLTKCKREACAPKAVGSDGKPLKGAAKNSFMAKCVKEQA